jgi:hypothetical protein
MALFRKDSGRAEAVYARVLDGEHLWLAVRGEGPLLLRRDGGDDLELSTEAAADAEGPLLSARFPLAAALDDDDADELELRLLSGSGRKAAPVAHAAAAPQGPGLAEPATHDGRWQLRVASADGEVVVRRSRRAPTVAVLGFATTDAGVEVRLDTPVDRAELVADGDRLAHLPIVDGSLSLAELPDLAAGVTATFRVGDADVVRSGNALNRPMAGVALPPLPEPDVTLRWTPDAVLAVRREEAT